MTNDISEWRSTNRYRAKEITDYRSAETEEYQRVGNKTANSGTLYETVCPD